MIRVRLETRSGVIRSIESEGHAAAYGDDSPACAVVSLILKALGEAVVEAADVRYTGAIPEPGEYRLRIEGYPESRGNWLRGITAITRGALQGVSESYPDAVDLKVSEEL